MCCFDVFLTYYGVVGIDDGVTVTFVVFVDKLVGTVFIVVVVVAAIGVVAGFPARSCLLECVTVDVKETDVNAPSSV